MKTRSEMRVYYSPHRRRVSMIGLFRTRRMVSGSLAGVLLAAMLFPVFHHVCAAGGDSEGGSILRCCCEAGHKASHHLPLTKRHCGLQDGQEVDVSGHCCDVQFHSLRSEAVPITVDSKLASYVPVLQASASDVAVVTESHSIRVSDATEPPIRPPVALHLLYGSILN